VLVLDEPMAAAPLIGTEPFTVVALEDVAIPDIDVMKGIYTAVEFSTAVKPWLLDWMFATAPDTSQVVYLDPDIQVFSRMVELEEALVENWAVLTPHLIEPNVEPSAHPTEQALLLAGIYNLGFLGLSRSETTNRFLTWWKERLARECIVDTAAGYFVDQRYIDFVPGLFDGAKILRHPGYNVAYWNASTRVVSQTGDDYYVNDTDLRFFHFSGFDPRDVASFSKHQDRIDLDQRNDLATLVSAYADALIAAGYLEFCRRDYPFARTTLGLTIGDASRQLYRMEIENGAGSSLFDEEGERAFREAVNAHDIEHPELTIWHAHFWRSSGKIQSDFPGLDSACCARFREWCARDNGVLDAYGSIVGLVDRELRVQDGTRMVVKPSALLGVNLVGYLNTASGVGSVGRKIVEVLDSSSIAVAPISIRAPQADNDVPFLAMSLDTGLPFDHTIACINADMLPSYAPQIRLRGTDDQFVTGVWWWELASVPPTFSDAIAHVDQLMVGSTFIRDAFIDVSPVPIHVFPVPITLGSGSLNSNADLREALNWPQAFTFYYSFDYSSSFARKNPIGLINAYKKAFSRSDGAHLVLKTLNDEHHLVEAAALREAILGRDDISIIDGSVALPVRDSLMHSCDCYVSLHRSEGLGLTLGEAMYAGKPVIATGYSGNMDFMNSENSFLVDYGMVPVGVDGGPYPAAASWADPDLEQAAHFMRLVFENSEVREQIARAGAVSIRETNSLSASGDAIMSALR
jgi:glycosyltransferase involved in cell wall biosynthesis